MITTNATTRTATSSNNLAILHAILTAATTFAAVAEPVETEASTHNALDPIISYDVGDYVQEGLVLHYDGIRNAGADAEHSDNAAAWKDLSPSHNDATITTVDAGATKGGEWREKGYFFNAKTNVAVGSIAHYAYGRVQNAQDFGSNFTFQIACDVKTDDATTYGNLYPTIFGVQEGNACNLYQFQGRNGKLHFKADITTGLASGTRARLPNWSGRYINAAVSRDKGDQQILTEGTSFSSGWTDNSSSHTAVYPGETMWGFGSEGFAEGDSVAAMQGEPDASRLRTRSLHGTINSIRVYNRVLTDEELAWNRMVDESRFFGPETPPATNVVVASSIDGLAGVEASGAYSVSGQYTLSATNMVVDGILYTPTGYLLQEWNQEADDWGEATLRSGSLCTVEEDAKVRITWQWRPVYIEDGLVLHYDGILNAGVGQPHSPSATVWKDLSPSGNDAEITVVNGGGEWLDDGYMFKRNKDTTSPTAYAYGTLAAVQDLGREFTVQIVASDVVTNIVDGLYPCFFGAEDGDTCNIYQMHGRNQIHFKADGVTGLNVNTRTRITQWGGHYVNAALGGGWQVVTESTAFDSWVGQNAATEVGPQRWMFGAAGVDAGNCAKRALRGAIKSIRVYNRVLTDEELAANRAVDEMRFFGGSKTGTRTVTVASAVPELSGNEPDGEYKVDADKSYVFSAPTEPVTANGMDYVVAGFSTEKWDDSAGDYGAAVTNAGASWALPAEAGKYRLTWLWRVTRGFDTTGGALTDYVHPESLAIHLDGIRNVGADKAHDPHATRWVNVAAGAASIKGESRFVDLMPLTQDVWTNSLASTWLGDGYYFNGHRYAVLDQNLARDLTIGRQIVVEVVCDVDTALLRNRWNMQRNLSGWGISVWPYLVGTTNAPSPLQMFYHAADDKTKGDYDMLRFKVNNQNFVTNAAYNAYTYPDGIPAGMSAFVGIRGWGGKYATGLHNYHNNGASNDGTIFEGEKPIKNWWFGPGLANDLGSMTVTVGGGNTLETGGYNRTLLVGNIKAVRIYKSEFSGGSADFIANRKVDDIRFHRAAPGETNVTVVARYGNATSYGSGVYNVIGTVHFEAWDAMTEDGSTCALLGCSVQEWDDAIGDWGEPAFIDREEGVEKMSYSYVDGESPASVRLVWRWKCSGMSVICR